jgi:hypothetical protein
LAACKITHAKSSSGKVLARILLMRDFRYDLLLPQLTKQPHGRVSAGLPTFEQIRLISSPEIRGRIADQANKLIRHFYGLGAYLSASNFPGAALFLGKATPPRATLAPAVHDFSASLLGIRRV